MSVSARKLAGLRRYHASRPVKTRLKLLEALDRMNGNRTSVVGRSFTWSKTTLAREAGVNINTIVRKLRSGAWMFPDVNERFEELKLRHERSTGTGNSDQKKIEALQDEVRTLREQNRRLALEVNRLGRQILQERDRANRMAVYETQNASLREEIRRLHQGTSVRKQVPRKTPTYA